MKKLYSSPTTTSVTLLSGIVCQVGSVRGPVGLGGEDPGDVDPL